MAASTAAGNLQSQIESLGATMQRGFEKLEQAVAGVDARLRNLETTEAGCRGVQDIRLSACDKSIADIKVEMAAMEARIILIEKELPIVRAVKWVAITLGGSIIALIWSLITGQAQLIIR